MRDAVVSGALPRVHLVTPAIVDKTIARHGVRGVLTDVEYRTLHAFPAEQRRRDWLAGRTAAKRALRAEVRGRGHGVLPYGAIELWNESDGAPRFMIAGLPAIGDQLNISIAHADGAAVAGVADTNASGTVGVDIEMTRALSDALVGRVLQPAEVARLRTQAAQPTALMIWTAKEAALKAAHADCSALRDVELTWGEDRHLSAHVIHDDARREIAIRHRVVGEYTIAVALYR
jgi:4'-phosphopantetheinyl transferase EntD